MDNNTKCEGWVIVKLSQVPTSKTDKIMAFLGLYEYRPMFVDITFEKAGNVTLVKSYKNASLFESEQAALDFINEYGLRERLTGRLAVIFVEVR